MEKLNCDIIQDLIPSYVDEICSDATRVCVEEHLKSCEGCKRIADLCRKTAFSGEALEAKQLDGLKKWKIKIKRQHLLNYLLLCLFLFGLYTFEGHPIPSLVGYYVLFVISLMGILFFTARQDIRNNVSKTDWIMIGSSLVLSVLNPLLLYFSLSEDFFSTLLLRVGASKVGILISNCLLACFILQMLFTIGLLHNYFHKEINNRFGACVTLSGAFLTLAYRTLLSHMNTLEHFQNQLLEITLVILGIGILACLLTCWRTPKRKDF